MGRGASVDRVDPRLRRRAAQPSIRAGLNPLLTAGLPPQVRSYPGPGHPPLRCSVRSRPPRDAPERGKPPLHHQRGVRPTARCWNEHLSVKEGTTWYESGEEMQTYPAVYIETYDRNRPHRDRSMEGRIPYQVFKEGIRKLRTREKSTGKEVKDGRLKR